jgi:hypothetical protein
VNTLNNTKGHDTNRGVELLLFHNRRRSTPKDQRYNKFALGKTISLFNREFGFNIELYVNKK